MNLSALNIDVLLLLVKFSEPEDGCNLAVSGVLKGFEMTNPNIDLSKRIKNIGVKFGLSYSSQQMEIRSFKCFISNRTELNSLKDLVKTGLFKNASHLDISLESTESRFTLDDLVHVFHFCPRLTRLSIRMYGCSCIADKVEMDDCSKRQLRRGFGRLHFVSLTDCLLDLFMGSSAFYQEVLTWCRECREMELSEDTLWFRLISEPNRPFSPSDPTFGQKLQKLEVNYFPDGLLKWLLPYYSNLRILINKPIHQLSMVLNEVCYLRSLRQLKVNVDRPNDLSEIFRHCLQLESLSVSIMSSTDVEDLAGVFRPSNNILDVNLHWMYQPSTEEVLPIFKKCPNLRRLKLKVNEAKKSVNFPRTEIIRDFILDMEYLSALHINDYFDYEQLKIFETKVNDLVKQRRPRFIFKVGSCL